jgi:Uma2 family endonuclease
MKVKEAIATYRVPRKTYTYQDYFEMPDDGNRYEIIEGELLMSPAPYMNHQFISLNLVLKLAKFVLENKLGKICYAPVDVLLSDFNIVQPDILFISSDNLQIITEKNIKGVPDLIIEIISPATGYYDLSGKKDLYEKFGVQEYWIVDPMKQRIDIYLNFEHKFELHQRLEKKGIVKSNILKGFEIDLETIFGLD